MDRKYSVNELYALRRVIQNKYLYGSYSGPSNNSISRSYKEAEMTTAVEEQVRTHMLAGHTADDLTDSSNVR